METAHVQKQHTNVYNTCAMCQKVDKQLAHKSVLN